MMRCSLCGTELLTQARFCHRCGSPVVPAESVSPDASLDHLSRYIPAELMDRIRASSRILGERRQVTILFADLVGSTVLAQSVGEEGAFELSNQILQAMIEPICEDEGVVARLMGDGVLAFFGAPIAHEDDPERALHAALGIHRRIQDVPHPGPDDSMSLRARIGIHTGLVVVGEVGSQGLRLEYTAMGDAVNLAARLEQAATPSTTLVSHAVYRLTWPYFEFAPIAPLKLKGFSQPVHTYELGNARPDVPKIRGLQIRRARLVGREREYEQIRQCLADLTDSQGQFASLAGEAGIGKSRLLAEVHQSISGDRVMWIEVRAASHARAPFGLPTSLLQSHFQWPDDGDLSALQTQAHEWLGAESPELLPELMYLLGRPGAARTGGLDRLEPDLVYQRIFILMRRFLEHLSERQSVVIVLDDLHWADDSSLDMLRRLLPVVRKLPILVIAAHRPAVSEACETYVGNAQRQYGDAYLHIDLNPLDAVEMAEYAQSLLEEHDLPRDQLVRLVHRSGGNPLFFEEILVDALETEQVVRASHRETPGIPDSVQGVLQARVDRFPEMVREVARRAAVFGTVVPCHLLREMLSEQQDLRTPLMELRQRGILEQCPEKGEEVYRFRHPLIQEILYQGILTRERRIYHRQAGLLLESRVADASPAELVYHFAAAEDWHRLLRYARQAGDEARLSYANGKALEYYEHALEAAQRVPIDPASASKLHRHMGDVLTHVGEYGRAEQAYRRALEEGSRCGTRQSTVRVLNQLSHLHTCRGEYDQAMECAEQARMILFDTPADMDKIELVRTLTQLGNTCSKLGMPDEAIQHHQEARELTRQLGETSLEAISLVNLGGLHFGEGHYEQARRNFTDALAVFRADTDLARVATVLGNLAMLPFTEGKYREALDLFKQALDIHQQIGNMLGSVQCQTNIGALYFRMGDYEAAEEQFVQALAEARQIGATEVIVSCLNNLGAIQSEQGQWESALQYYEEASNMRREVGDVIGIAVDLYNIAEIHLKRRAPELALGPLQQALTIRHTEHWVTLRLTHQLAEAYLQMGRRKEAARLVCETLARAETDQQARGMLLCQLGRATIGRLDDDPSRHFESSLEILKQINAQPEYAHTLYWYADFLLNSEVMEANRQGLEYLEQAAALFEQLKMAQELDRTKKRILDARNWETSSEAATAEQNAQL